MHVIRHHHERYDGSGYPDGLSGSAIPLGAQIVSVADAYDAITSTRPYRKGLPAEEAAARIYAERGKQFSPPAVDAFKHVFDRNEIAEVFELIAPDYSDKTV